MKIRHECWHLFNLILNHYELIIKLQQLKQNIPKLYAYFMGHNAYVVSG